jgi:hypothetical protein
MVSTNIGAPPPAEENYGTGTAISNLMEFFQIAATPQSSHDIICGTQINYADEHAEKCGA